MKTAENYLSFKSAIEFSKMCPKEKHRPNIEKARFEVAKKKKKFCQQFVCLRNEFIYCQKKI